MKKTLLCVGLFVAFAINAQDGNTIENAIEINGTSVSVNILNYNSATNSGLTPACDASEDVFYKHVVSTGDNKVQIGMASLGLTLAANIDYQIFLAPSDDLGQLQELECDSYNIVALVGGSFEVVLDNVTPSDAYYLRVYKNNQALINLSSLLSGTSITMNSVFDATLSNVDVEENNVKVLVSQDQIRLVNNTSFNSYQIYGLDGKIVKRIEADENIAAIDTSYLSDGFYVLNLINETENYTYKFIKY